MACIGHCMTTCRRRSAPNAGTFSHHRPGAKKFETTECAIRKSGVNTPIAESASSLLDAPSVAIPVAGCLLVCEQCETIARTLTNEQYTMHVAGKASIGEHLRHCVEHFGMLFEGLKIGIIDYDARRRNAELETSSTNFIAAIHNIAMQLKSLDEVAMTRPLTVRMLFAPNADAVEVASTLGRELGFVSSHAIHHIAIVKMLAHSLGASLPEEYGVGHATMSHRSICTRAPSRA
jgi:hypothetical protein